MSVPLSPWFITSWMMLATALVPDGSPHIAEPEFSEQVTVLRDQVAKAVNDTGLDAQVEVDDQLPGLEISYRTRDYRVYRRNKTGVWSRDLHTVTGPRHDGFQIRLAFGRGPYRGAWNRGEVTLRDYSLGSTIQYPYFVLRGSIITLPQLDAHILVNIYLGAQTDPIPVVQLHRAILTACADQGWTQARSPQQEITPATCCRGHWSGSGGGELAPFANCQPGAGGQASKVVIF